MIKAYDEIRYQLKVLVVFLTKKMTVLQRTVVWLIAIALFFFILLLLIIWELKQSVQQGYDPTDGLIILYFIGVSIVIGLIIKVFRTFARPITELTENAMKIAGGDYEINFDIDKYDVEWQLLMSVFNKMSAETQRKIEELNDQNDVLFTYKEQIEELNQRLSKKINIKSKQLQDYLDIVDNNVITSQTDVYGIIIYASEAFCHISGYTKEELIGKNHRILRHPDMSKELYEGMWQTISSGQTWHGEVKNRKSDGGYYWVDMTITPNIEEDKITGYTAIRHDISDKKVIEEMAITDSMTGLFNRRHYARVMHDELNRMQRNHQSLALLMMDVDYFKRYNDTYGHHAGDVVLNQIADILKEYTSRSGEYAFRLGGEEFGILVCGMSRGEYVNLANRIRNEVEKLKLIHGMNDAESYITLSVGIAVFDPESAATCEDLYKEADLQLYAAKDRGRNQVVIGEAIN